MKASHTATVTASPEQVWIALADHEGMSSWGPGMKVTIDRPSAVSPGGVGTVRRISAPGPAPAIVEEVTTFEPGQRLGYKALSGVPFRNYHGTVDLTPDGTGTRIVWTLEADGLLAAAGLKPVVVGLLTALVRHLKKTA